MSSIRNFQTVLFKVLKYLWFKKWRPTTVICIIAGCANFEVIWPDMHSIVLMWSKCKILSAHKTRVHNQGVIFFLHCYIPEVEWF